jgi:hypothetical protein
MGIAIVGTTEPAFGAGATVGPTTVVGPVPVIATDPNPLAGAVGALPAAASET